MAVLLVLAAVLAIAMVVLLNPADSFTVPTRARRFLGAVLVVGVLGILGVFIAPTLAAGALVFSGYAGSEVVASIVDAHNGTTR